MNNINLIEKNFINRDKLYDLLSNKPPNEIELNEILNKALNLKGISLNEVAKLLLIEKSEQIKKIQQTAQVIKNKIYGKRLVLFAPLYLSNYCDNNCLYCAFRKENKIINRKILIDEEIKKETEILLRQGHKRVLVLTGEYEATGIDYLVNSIKTIYSVKIDKNYIRRINVEVAPMEIDDFKKLKEVKIGTYICFQETYDEQNYKKYHLSGKKSDFLNRLFVMDKALSAGLNDIGIGVLFGLSDYRFEVLALLEHCNHLEKKFGCGPHTISVPRIEPARGATLSYKPPYPVSDNDFKKIVAVLRLAVPYTGIILSTRESEDLRNELFNYGVSQISAGSRTNPGAYSDKNSSYGAQFSLGDHRTLDEVISSVIDLNYIPSFCTSCYRKGRVGKDFMDLAKPGLIQKFCEPNGIITFYEYLLDFASKKTKEKGINLINELLNSMPLRKKEKIKNILNRLNNGERDVFL